MNEPPVRLREQLPESSDGRLQELLRAEARDDDWSDRDRSALWRKIEASGPGRSPTLVYGLGLAAAGAALAALLTIGWPLRSSRVDQIARSQRRPQQIDWKAGTLEANDGARYHILTEGAEEDSVYLERGTLRAQVRHRPLDRPLCVKTPHLRACVVGTCFSTAVMGAASRVSVEEGRVRVQRIGHRAEVFVGPGETIGSDDARLADAPAVVATPSPMESVGSVKKSEHTQPTPCEDQEGPTKIRCYERVARGSDLAAQNALYSLGLIEREQRHDGKRALERWRTYQRRFPNGVLAAEVGSGVIALLLENKRYTEVLTETDRFLADHSGSRRAAEVALIRANLLREHFDQERALTAYRSLLAQHLPTSLRSEALFFAGACESALGRSADALKTWTQYQKEFPRGIHAEEVDKLLKR